MQKPTAAGSEMQKDHSELISFVGLFLTLATANIALLATVLTYGL
jgi:hypothetical protein